MIEGQGVAEGGLRPVPVLADGDGLDADGGQEDAGFDCDVVQDRRQVAEVGLLDESIGGRGARAHAIARAGGVGRLGQVIGVRRSPGLKRDVRVDPVELESGVEAHVLEVEGRVTVVEAAPGDDPVRGILKRPGEAVLDVAAEARGDRWAAIAELGGERGRFGCVVPLSHAVREPLRDLLSLGIEGPDRGQEEGGDDRRAQHERALGATCNPRRPHIKGSGGVLARVPVRVCSPAEGWAAHSVSRGERDTHDDASDDLASAGGRPRAARVW